MSQVTDKQFEELQRKLDEQHQKWHDGASAASADASAKDDVFFAKETSYFSRSLTQPSRILYITQHVNGAVSWRDADDAEVTEFLKSEGTSKKQLCDD
jgi:hypothetical protein